MLDKTDIAKMKFDFMELLARDKRLNGVPFRVAYWIVFVNWNPTDGFGRPGYGYLANQLGCSKEAVKDAVKKFGQDGLGYFWVERIWKQGGKQRLPNHYYPNWEVGNHSTPPLGNSSTQPGKLQDPPLGNPSTYKPCIINPVNEPYISSSDDDGVDVRHKICVIEGCFKDVTKLGTPSASDLTLLQYRRDALKIIMVEWDGEKEVTEHARRVCEDMDYYFEDTGIEVIRDY